VILACRTVEKAETARALLKERTGKDPFQALAMDTSEIASANAAADELSRRGEKVDFLVLNAGASGATPKYNAEGVELTWASTLVGHHVLTMRLLGDGRLTQHARIIIAGSEGARGNLPGMSVHDIPGLADENFGGDRSEAIAALCRIAGPFEFINMREYVTAKLVVAWWAAALSRKLPKGMTVNAVSPGSAPGTNFGRDAPATMKYLMMPMMKLLGPLMGMGGSIEKAAARYVESAERGDDDSGHFYATAHKKKLVGPVGMQTWPSYFIDQKSQEAAFKAVVALTKTDFPNLDERAA
jgi:NAD(P)-dependent dehydrogenase (short-subunit alcohol dehydrogenase family)